MLFLKKLKLKMNSKVIKKTNSRVTEVLHVTSKKVFCDGGKLDMGHPRVYLNMGDKDYVTCPYCSKIFTTNQNIDVTSIKN